MGSGVKLLRFKCSQTQIMSRKPSDYISTLYHLSVLMGENQELTQPRRLSVINKCCLAAYYTHVCVRGKTTQENTKEGTENEIFITFLVLL